MITLNQIKKYNPCIMGWESVVEANGGVKADYEKPFALSTVLDSNGLDHTLWCFRALPEHKPILEKFVLFCVKEASVPTDGEVVHNAITVLEKHILKSEATSEELSNACKGIYDILFNEPRVSNNMIARAVMYAIRVVRIKMLPSSDTSAHNPITHAACSTVYYSNRHSSTTSFEDKRQKQKEYLRMLLDGEKYGKPEVSKPQSKNGLWSSLTKPFKGWKKLKHYKRRYT